MQGLGSQVCGIRYGPRSTAQAQTAARYTKKAQPQGNLRCTYETTNKPNKPNKPNNIIDSAAAIVFNRNFSQKNLPGAPAMPAIPLTPTALLPIRSHARTTAR